MPMGDQGFLRMMVADPRLAQFAIGVRPVWLWSTDGSRILWCNAAAADVLGLDATSVAKPLSPANMHRRQVAQLAGRLSLKGATRLDRLRGFGAALGQLMTCACTRIEMPGAAAVMMVAMDAAAQAPLPLAARLQFLVDAIDEAALIVLPDGALAAANQPARDLVGNTKTLGDLDLEPSKGVIFAAPSLVLDADGRRFGFHRLGSGPETAALALVTAIPAEPETPAESEVPADMVAANDRILNEPLIDEPAFEQGPVVVCTEAEASDLDPETLMTDHGPSGEIGGQPAATVPAATTDHSASARPVPRASAVVTPLRFVWQTDQAGHFTLTSNAFLHAAGPRTASMLGRSFGEIAEALDLDPQGRIAETMSRRETWSGIAVAWPLDTGTTATVELSGVPTYDTDRAFAGYRGFGLCRAMPPAAAEPEPTVAATPADQPAPEAASDVSHAETTTEDSATTAPALSSMSDRATDEPQREPPKNVVQFRPVNEVRTPSLSAIENRAFDEIARRLTQTFDIKARTQDIPPASPASERTHDDTPAVESEQHAEQQPVAQPAWLSSAAAPPHGDSARDRLLLDLMPSGVLIYRLDRLLYANSAFLTQTGFATLSALQDAGGLDALYVEPGPATASSASDDGMPLKIAAPGGEHQRDARLFTIQWDGENAHALIVPEITVSLGTHPAAESTTTVEPAASADAEPVPTPQALAASAIAPQAPPPANGELDAILENATDGIVLFDRSGAVTSSNRSAQVQFNIPANDFLSQNVADLFAMESQRIVLDYFESIDQQTASTPADHGREVLGRTRIGGFVPLSMTMGKIGHDGERFFAVFRDLSQLKKSESDLLYARRKAERASEATGDALARISHEVRGPLNTIIGFANVMLEERFGSLGNDRYSEYLKDIRASGERAIAIVDDLVNITSIESGNVQLKPTSQNLNEMVEQCVGALQPQANRERIIIRTSLAHALPQVLADGQALRQIIMNLITSSIRFSKAGGQVIVSTAAADNGGAILRVRDTGRGLSEAELALAMDPQRIAPPSDRIDRSSIDLSLARALAEANRARFQIRSTAQTGTLIEVVFPGARALAG